MKNFTAIARECSRFLKKYWFYRNNQEKYLEMKNITDNDIEKIKSDFSIEFNVDNLPDAMKTSELENDKNMLLNALTVNSFYNNHKLYTSLTNNHVERDIYYMFTERIFINNNNQNVSTFNIVELQKNIQYINAQYKDKENFNLLVLKKALKEGKIELLEVIKPYVSWDTVQWKDRDNQFKECLIEAIIENGKNLANTEVAKEINKYMTINNFINESHEMIMSAKKQKNINSYYNVNIIELLIKEDKLHLNKINHSQAKKLLKIIETIPNATNRYIEYLEANYPKVSIKKRLERLKKKDILTEDFWNTLIESKNMIAVENIFINQHEIKNLIPEKIVKQLIEKYKAHIVSMDNFMYYKLYHKQQNNDVCKFIKLYPYQLDIQEIQNLVQKEASHVSLMNNIEIEARKLIKDKYEGQLELEEHDNFNGQQQYYQNMINNQEKLLTLLYQKYPDVMNNEKSLISMIESVDNDSFINMYIRKYFKDNTNEKLKKEIVSKLKILTSVDMSSNVLEWVIENKLLETLIPKYNEYAKNFIFAKKEANMYAPILIEKYNISPDAVIKQTLTSFISNNELFRFILNNYDLQPKTKQELCNSVFAINEVELATELFKKGIAPNEYYIEKFTNAPSEAGNILLKSSLKEKLESVDKIEKKKIVKKI